ncbi:hypothetical protein [Paraburkholderia sp. GAS42]|jgi:hypothetical protein|uniref:hypothetical protein n=1 Tax=Paraburkholderia sp. GAS42 TaxID=3035135 RepID=UPI003D255A7B
MRTLTANDPNGQTVITTLPDGMIDLVADGFGPALIGFPTTKMTLVQQRINGDGESNVHREVVAVVSISTASILEFAKMVQDTIAGNKDAVVQAFAQMQQIVDQI